MDLEIKKNTVRKKMFMSVALAALAPAALLTATAVTAPAFAQDYTSGAIAGNVVDASGAPVAGATVTVTSVSQGFTRSATTSSSGGYRFGSLSAGAYEVRVSSIAGSTTESVSVSASSTTNYNFVIGGTSDNVIVTGTRQNFDFANTTTGVNLDVENLVKEIPVGRNLNALTLFAPTAVQGGSAQNVKFAQGAALGGSSVAENAFYVNGLNTTNFDNYIGSSTVPFDFYKSVEVKTGGYPAEFGRATGGVINAVTKAGTNEWQGAVHLNWEPDSLLSDAPDTYRDANRLDRTRTFDAIVELGGPIIKDHLFVYGLAEFNDNLDEDASITGNFQDSDRANDPIWGGKVDAYITDDQHLEFTYFDTRRQTVRTTRGFDNDTSTIGDITGQTIFPFGGKNFVGKYTGSFTEWLTVSAAYGKTRDTFAVLPTNSGNLVIDSRDGSNTILSAQTEDTVESPYDTEREFYRADIDLYFNLGGDHHVRAGFDKEDNTLLEASVRTGQDMIDGGVAAAGGGVVYTYLRCGAITAQCMGAPTLSEGDDYVSIDYYNSGGSFKSTNTAFYVQDEWNVTDRLTLNLGVRLDHFENFTADGTQYVDLTGNFAPRTGFSYDGDGSTRVFANFGQYYLPVAANTAFRNYGAEFFFQEYHTFTGMNSDGTPILDQQITGFSSANNCPFSLYGSVTTAACTVTGDGSVPSPAATTSSNLKATKENEIIFGVSHQLDDLWTFGLTYTHRNLVTTAEDSAVDAAVIAYCDAEGISGCDAIWTGFHQYVIANPNNDIVVELDGLINGESTPRTVTLLAEDTGYPSAVRKYDSIEFTFNRAFDGTWNLRGSYTWSNSRGNSEGYVQSDYGQDDSGITIDFDQPGFTEGSYGKLPNHRAHSFKLWGSYQVTDRLLFGASGQLISPKKYSCYGNYPDPDNFAAAYGRRSHYCLNRLQPRGTGLDGDGRHSDWLKNVDVSARYNFAFNGETDMTVRLDVFNIFNFDSELLVDEYGENNFENGVLRPQYGLPVSYQTPRTVRVGLDLNF